MKLRINTFDKAKLVNKPIKINFGDIKDKNKIFLNLNKLPIIIPRLSFKNFHKRIINNNNDFKELRYNEKANLKQSIFNKTSVFKGITFNKGLSNFRKTNYKINKMNNLKPINSFIK